MAFGFPDKSKLFPMQISVQHLSFLPPEIIEWFKAAGSSVIPSIEVASLVDISYSAFYVSGKNTIALEHIKYSNKKTISDYATPLDIVYDSIADIGATGYPRRTYEALETFLSPVGGTNNEIKRMPTSSLVTPIANYGLKPTDIKISNRK